MREDHSGSSGVPQNEGDTSDTLARIDQRLVEIAKVLGERDGSQAGPSNPVPEIGSGVARVVAELLEGGPTPLAADRGRITEASILEDVVLVERVARRLRRFVQGIVTRTVEVTPVPQEEPPPIDDVTRAKARRALARSGFVKVTA
jgi:hypothetical protein